MNCAENVDLVRQTLVHQGINEGPSYADLEMPIRREKAFYMVSRVCELGIEYGNKYDQQIICFHTGIQLVSIG